MKALVTGIGGFVGAHLAARLVADGWDVAGTVRPGGSQTRLVDLGLRGAVDVLEADLADPRATEAVGRAARADVAFLLAAARAADTPAARAATTAVNSTGPAWLIDALWPERPSERGAGPERPCERGAGPERPSERGAGPERPSERGAGDQGRAVVRLGSSTEYARTNGPIDETAPVAPQSFFGATKAAGSLLLAAAAARPGVRSTILRAFQVYGPLDHVDRLVPTALRAGRDGTTLPLTEPGRCRDWVYVDDVVECCVRAALADDLPSGQVLNVGTGRQTTNEDLVAEVERVTGRSIDVAVGAHGGRQWDARSWVSDPSLARDLLGWEAKVDLADGLARCWESCVR